MSESARLVDAWLKSGRHLPPAFRDHHAQKDVFKWIWRRTTAGEEGVENGLHGMSWIAAHVLVVDYFLWFMAKHGYTLQRSRQPLEFRDWDESIGVMKRDDAEAFRKVMEERSRASSGGGG